MSTPPTHFDPRILARLEGLRLRARRIVEGFVSGLHRSPWRGFSIEFAEHREYVPGDDLRYVDWKAYGRSDKLYLKRYEDETNLVAYVVLDASASMEYRGPASAMSKGEYARCLAAALAWLVLQQNDAVGVAAYDETVRGVVRPGTRTSHWQPVLRFLEEISPRRVATESREAFRELAARLPHRGVVIVISDLFDDLESLIEGLGSFQHRRHDVKVLQVVDEAELDFPFRDAMRFDALESGDRLVVEAAELRQAYRAEVEAHLRALRVHCRRQGIAYELLKTSVPFDLALSRLLGARGQGARA